MPVSTKTKPNNLFFCIEECANVQTGSDSVELHRAFASIQHVLGTDDGGVAGDMFSAVSDGWDDMGFESRVRFLAKYVRAEITTNVFSEEDS